MEAVAPHALRRSSARGSPNACATCACVRWNAVSKQATCGKCGACAAMARIGARLCGWCSGASGTSVSSSAMHRVIDPHGGGEVHAAMHDAVSDSRELARGRAGRPIDLHQFQRRRLVVQALGRPCLLGHSLCPPRRAPSALGRRRSPRPGRETATGPSSEPMDGELDAGGAGVEDGDAVVHSFLTR